MQFKSSSTVVDANKKDEILHSNLKLLKAKLREYRIENKDYYSAVEPMIHCVETLSNNNILAKDISENETFEADVKRINCSIYLSTKDGMKQVSNSVPVVVDVKGQVIGDGILAHSLYFYNYNRNQCIDYHIIGKNINNSDFDIDVTNLDSKDINTIIKLITNDLKYNMNSDIEAKVLKHIKNHNIIFQKNNKQSLI